ncbi:MAG: amidohydrolase family protein [Deltaproteobacteria bacterium]|nr:amidohydrolase family protein [Deltaproteobacteria bacterium]
MALTAGAREADPDPRRPYPGPPSDQNDLVLEAGERLSGELMPFVFIPADEPDPLKRYQGYEERGCRGLAVWRMGYAGERPLTDPAMEPLYRYIEIRGIPVIASIGRQEYLPEVVRLLRDHPNLKVISAGLLGFPEDLPRVQRTMELFPNLFVDTGFDADAGFEEVFRTIGADLDGARDFFDLMQDRIVFAGGLTFDHRLYRRGQWGAQIFKVYRSFLEREEIALRVRGDDGQWYPVRIPALALDEDILKKIYHHNFQRVVGRSLSTQVSSDLDFLLTSAPAGWSFDPVSPHRVVAALVAPKRKLVSTVSTQRLRDLFAGRLTDWRELNGEPGPIRVASYGPLAKVVADQLDVPLVAPLDIHHDAAEATRAIERDGDLLGIIPLANVPTHLEVITVDGDNPLVSNIKYCASKSSPTIAHYFTTYPLLIPVRFGEDANTEPFDPFEIRTVLIGGRVTAKDEGPIIAPVDAETEDRLADAMRPVYDILPSIRAADFSVFLGRPTTEREQFLLRVLGASATADNGRVARFGTEPDPAGAVCESAIRGVPVSVAGNPTSMPEHGIRIAALPAGATDDDVQAALAAGAHAVLAGDRLEAVAGLGALKTDLGSFFGDTGATGAYAFLSFYGDRLVSADVVPVMTEGGIVARRYGEQARRLMLDAYSNVAAP